MNEPCFSCCPCACFSTQFEHRLFRAALSALAHWIRTLMQQWSPMNHPINVPNAAHVCSHKQRAQHMWPNGLLQRKTDVAVKASRSSRMAAIPAAWTNHSWEWKYCGSDHKINYAVAGCGPPLILVHGFGASCGQWRKNIPELAKRHKVYAIDLLGFGASEKSLMNYTIQLWAQLVSDFAKEFVDQPYVLVGNSIGSLVSLQAAKLRRNAGDPPQPCGIVLINCAGGMNNKARLDDWRIRIAYPLFLVLDAVLKIEIIAARLFKSFRTAENVRQVLKSVYINSDAVDDELVDIICKPADDPNALAVLVSVVTGPPGPRPEDLMGPVGKFFADLPQTQSSVTFELLENTGHCAKPLLLSCWWCDLYDVAQDGSLSWPN